MAEQKGPGLEQKGRQDLATSREAFYFHSGEVSKIARQLSFAGIAIIWLFKYNSSDPVAIPSALYVPSALIVIGLLFDFYSMSSAH